MNESRRQALIGFTSIGLFSAIIGGSSQIEAEPKPVTKSTLIKSLLTLAEKAERSGLVVEARLIMAAAKNVWNVPDEKIRPR